MCQFLDKLLDNCFRKDLSSHIVKKKKNIKTCEKIIWCQNFSQNNYIEMQAQFLTMIKFGYEPDKSRQKKIDNKTKTVSRSFGST